MFLKCTHKKNDAPVVFNSDYVIKITKEDDGGAAVLLNTGDKPEWLLLQETFEKVTTVLQRIALTVPGKDKKA
jgi:hypothetical protein